jgi:DAK2 domain fusion protein YloV
MALYAQALRRHRDEINSLNVFPVPDGDTGTNMLLTQEAVERELAALDGHASTLGSLGQAISRASLMGARGNSGVILSQVLRGVCERLPTDGVAGPNELAAALTHASSEADRAVAKPMDGTVLSVLRDAARAAEATAVETTDCADVADAALAEARRSLATTRSVLPELRAAGVVDAGAKGLVLLFDALHAALREEPLSEPAEPPGPVGRTAEHRVPQQDLRFPFEVQYLLEAGEVAVGALRRRLEPLGDSLVIVGGGGLYHVHVHTDDPQAVVSVGDQGARDVSVVDLRSQVTDCIAGQARAVRVAEQVTGLVVVAEGDGLADTLRSLGAMVVGRRSDGDPLASDLVAGVEAAPGDSVVVLAELDVDVAVAEQAGSTSPKDVRVLQTRSVTAGLAAAAAFNPLLSVQENLEAMAATAVGHRSGEVVRAEEDGQTPAGGVRRGAWIGRSDGVVVRGDGPESVAAQLAALLADDGAEIITLVTGAEATEERAAAVARAVADAVPGLKVEVVDGGQSAPPYLIGAE